MKVHVKLYKNTFFNKVNLPSSPSVILDSGEFEPFFEDDLFLVQNRYLATIRINKEFAEICDCDYVIAEAEGLPLLTMFYTVENIEMLNEKTCELTLMTDPLNSCGGLLQGDGYCKVIPVLMNASRMHVRDDEFGKYTLPEDFTPNEPLQIELSGKIGQQTNSRFDLFITTLFANVEEDPKAVSLIPASQTENKEVLLIPETEPVPANTQFGIGSKICSNSMGCVCSIQSGNDQPSSKLIEKLRQFGVENSILASYTFPAEYIGESTASTKYGVGYFSKLSGCNKIFSAGGITVIQPSVNKKCSVGDFNKVILASNCSGEKVEANIEEVSTGGGLSVRIVADPRSDGRPTASFANYHGFSNAEYQMQAVNGLQWASAPINFTEKSGSAVDRLNLQTSQQYKLGAMERNVNATAARGTMGVISGIASAASGNLVGGLISAVGAGVSAGVSANNMRKDYEEATAMETEIFNRNQTYVQPEINFPLSQSVRDAFGNCFYIVKYKLSANDLKAYDNYLTQFGYNVGNKQITYEDLYSREHYNYIKLNQCHLSTAYIPLFLREQLETLLRNGVRLWHVKPKQEYMVAGGNNTK